MLGLHSQNGLLGRSVSENFTSQNRCFYGPKRYKTLTTTCSLETQRHFYQRLEAKGWQDVRKIEGNEHPIVKETWNALQTIYGLGIVETPLQKSPWLQEASSAGSVSLKLETCQVTGSFKARGAAHKLLSLSPEQRAAGIVTSSTGNHALAVLYAVSSLATAGKPIKATIYVPSTISPAKFTKLQKAAEKSGGAEIVVSGTDCVEAEYAARQHAEDTHQTYISPYNDVAIIGGQGTIAPEICEAVQAGKINAVLVPVGGGGLVAGIAAFLKNIDQNIAVFGCQPARSNVMQQSVIAGHIVDDVEWQETLSDGTAGGIEKDSMTLEACQKYVDEWVTVEEHEIAKAMVSVQRHHGISIEGSAGVAVASFLKVAERLRGQHVVIVCCGGNVSQEMMDKAYSLVQI